MGNLDNITKINSLTDNVLRDTHFSTVLECRKKDLGTCYMEVITLLTPYPQASKEICFIKFKYHCFFLFACLKRNTRQQDRIFKAIHVVLIRMSIFYLSLKKNGQFERR